ncbi:MAG: clostripain-related cysteine peptidase [Fluviicola sp.]
MKYLFCIFLFLCGAQSTVAQKDSCDWIFIYYAPYDNDLSHFSDSILNQLSTATQYDNIRVVFQVDKDDTLGMYRYAIGPNGIKLDTIPSEESTSSKQLTNYLDWVNQNYVFERSAVFFLDHGGGLDEVGQDLHPDSTFLKTRDIRKSLQQFNRKNKNQVDLLYLQVCAKSSIEPFYELHKLSKWTLASQKLLGAPNYYYNEMLRYASIGNIDHDGSSIAQSIMGSERPDMYESLTLIDNDKFDLIKSQFRNLITELSKREEVVFKKAPKNFDYGKDRYWDLVDFLDCLILTTQEEIQAKDELKNSILNYLIDTKHVGAFKSDDYSGISIAALSKDRIRAYWHMKFYRGFKFDKLPLE